MLGSNLLSHASADFHRGFGVGFEDLLIAALVVLPFSATLGILLQAMGLPGPAAVIVAGLAQGVAMFWNAGWRARGGE
jgi:hypothetical protein